MVGFTVDQENDGGGVVTYSRGPKLDQRMRELQWRPDNHCSTSKMKISDDKEK